ncbi:MAG: hypothetical protein Q9181_003103, partial [Wetmoreana brouardii]
KSLPNHSIDLSYPTGPISLSPSDIPGYDAASAFGTEQQGSEPEAFGWWRRKDIPNPNESKGRETKIVYTGLQDGLDTIAQTIEDEGPFDGVIGFSQGACAAAMVASLLEPRRQDRFLSFSSDRMKTGEIKEAYPESFISTIDPAGGAIQPPLKFAIIYSGFRAPGTRYSAFYDPPIATPTLHFLGALDGVVEEARSRALIEVCEDAKVVVHPGGHFLPSQRPWLDAAAAFVNECLRGKGDVDGASGDGDGKGKEEKAEDMDVPF